MTSKKLLITKNYQQIEQAKQLGMPEPEIDQSTTEILFWKRDIKRVVLDDNKMMISFEDDDAYAFEYDKAMWDELKEFFIENEE